MLCYPVTSANWEMRSEFLPYVSTGNVVWRAISFSSVQYQNSIFKYCAFIEVVQKTSRFHFLVSSVFFRSNQFFLLTWKNNFSFPNFNTTFHLPLSGFNPKHLWRTHQKPRQCVLKGTTFYRMKWYNREKKKKGKSWRNIIPFLGQKKHILYSLNSCLEKDSL